ncbi:MAG: hypothetical protein ACI4JB_09675 [Porcipelethomonas sp.]
MLKKFSAIVVTLCMIFCFTACGSSEFEEKGDYLTGNNWEGTDGSMIQLNTDGTFKFYRSSSDKSNNYYTGNFEVKNGQDAIDYLVDEYGFTEDGQRSVMTKYQVEDQFYYVLILNSKECIVDGENTLSEEAKVEYFGYYSTKDGHLDFTSLKTMGQMDFYKK